MMKNIKPWDGYDKTGRYFYDTDDDRFKYFIDENGSIYYNYPEHPDLLVWCPASQLTSHLRRLEQIKAR